MNLLLLNVFLAASWAALSARWAGTPFANSV